MSLIAQSVDILSVDLVLLEGIAYFYINYLKFLVFNILLNVLSVIQI